MRSGSSFSDRGAKKKQTTMLSFFGSSQSPKIQNISHGIGGMAECDSPTSHGGVTSPMSMMDIQVEPDNNEHGEFSSPSKKNRFKTDQFSYDHDEFRREKRKSSHLSVSYSDDDSKNDPDFLIKQSCKVFKNLDSVSRIKQTIVSGNFSDECVQKDGLMSEFGSLNDEFLVADVEISEMSSQSFNFPPNQQRVLENSKNSASIRGYSYSGDVTNMEGGKCNILVPRTSIFAKTNDEGNENIQVNPDRYKWLIDVRDEAGRRPGEDGYDSRTLYIPKAQWNKFTPFERQFWEIKCKLYDTVVFFKKGKFYELYENDADVGAREFDLKVADRVNMRMAGVPEATFESWAARFVAAGYKIARVDQTETAMGKVVREKDAANASNKSKQSNSKESIIGRELKCILTSGTVSDPEFLGDRSNYCISLKFNHGGIIGMAAVDAAAGKFYLDDIKSINSSENCSVLEMVLRQMQPRELLLERGLVPSEMQHMIQRVLVNIKCAISYLEPVEFIQEERLFLEFGHSIHEHLLSDDSSSNHNTVKNSKYFNEVPGEIIRRIGELSLSALGGLFSYLKTLKLDQSLFSYAMFSPYQDKPSEIIKDGSTDELETALEMIIDGQVLVDLDVIPTASTSKKDTLLGLLDKCFTAPGKRLTERWILRPLRSATAINARLDAVEALMKNKDGLMDILSSTLTGAPDIERLLARAHTKAIKIKDFCSLIDSLQRLSEASSNFLQNSTVPLIRLISSRIPDFIDHLSTISQSFDRNSALIDGKF